LAAEYGDSALFVLKDPRICRLAPFWLPVLRDTGCRTLVILPLRHPRDVAASLEHRAGYDRDYGLLMWLRHVLDAEAETRGTRRVFTSYEALMTDWSAEIRRIGEGLGLSWPRSVSVARPEIDAFLSRDLQHFARTGVERAATTALPVLVRKTYEILTTWAQEGERPSDHGRLDKLRGKLDAATDSFGGLARRGEEWRNQAREYRTAHHELAGTHNRQTAELEAARAQIALLDPEVVRLNAETQRLEAEVEVQKRERAEEFGLLHSRLAEAGQRLTEIDRLRSEAVAAAAEARTTLIAEARGEAEAARAAFAAQAEAAAEERRRLQAELAAAALRLDDMAAELAAAEARAARLGEVEAELHQARSALIQREEETEQLRRHLETLDARSARLETELDAARAMQADTEHERDRVARRLSRLTAQATATMERDLTLRLARIEARGRTAPENRPAAAEPEAIGTDPSGPMVEEAGLPATDPADPPEPAVATSLPAPVADPPAATPAKPKRPHDGVKPPFRGLKRLWRRARGRVKRRP
jgi:hypothetical protein